MKIHFGQKIVLFWWFMEIIERKMKNENIIIQKIINFAYI